MGLLDKIMNKINSDGTNVEAGVLYSPMSGKIIPLEQIPDDVFSQGILGPGIGIEPTEGFVVSPVNGTITSIADSKHAIGIQSDEGAEILIHVGMDTVDMNGDGFSVDIRSNQHVSCGQKLMSFSIDKIKKANHPATTAIVLTNADEFPDFKIDVIGEIAAKEKIGAIMQ